MQKDSSGEMYYYNGSFHNAIDFFEYRKKDFLDCQSNYTWLSWNVADAYVKKELMDNTYLSSLK